MEFTIICQCGASSKIKLKKEEDHIVSREIIDVDGDVYIDCGDYELSQIYCEKCRTSIDNKETFKI